MAYAIVSAGVQCRFELDRLCISPDLVDATHKFVHNAMPFTLQLPHADREDVPFQQRRLHLIKWRTEGAIPLEYKVDSVDLEVDVTDPIQIPEELLQRPPKQFDLLTASEQERLDALLVDAEQRLRDAFAHWLSVLRWKTGIGYIGEPMIRYAGGSDGGAVLRERATKHRFWLQPQIITVVGNEVVTSTAWDLTQAALTAGKVPPIWFEFLFDSQMKINNKDHVAGVLSLAIALEVNLRSIFSSDLMKADLQPVLLEVFDLANMRALLTRLKKIRHWNDKWAAATDFSAFHKLMDYRDGVMHQAKTDRIDVKSLRNIYGAVETFAFFTTDALGLG